VRCSREAGLGVSPYAFTAAVVACGLAAGLLAWLIVALPAAVFAGVLAGGVAPIAWVRSRRERLRRERERAWPAVLSQLADALEAGLGWPAAVALVARAGRRRCEEWSAFAARLRGADLDTALEGLRGAEETHDGLRRRAATRRAG
jgi:tight adherence protein B